MLHPFYTLLWGVVGIGKCDTDGFYRDTIGKNDAHLREELKLWFAAKEKAGGLTPALWLTRYHIPLLLKRNKFYHLPLQQYSQK